MEIPVTKYHGCGNDFVLMHESDVKHIDPKHGHWSRRHDFGKTESVDHAVL